MVDAAPFRALRYDPAVAGDLSRATAPAYDHLARDTYAAHRTASPYTALELLTRGPDGYRAASAALERWQRLGVLRTDPRPAYYAYELRDPGRDDGHPSEAGPAAGSRSRTVQHGVLAAVRTEPLAAEQARSVLPHEQVDADRVADRMARLAEVPVDVTPVVAVAGSLPADVRHHLGAVAAAPPLAAVVDDDGVEHRVWRLDDPRTMATIRHGLAPLRVVIADGHHRYAAAWALRDRDPRTLVLVVDGALDRADEGPQVLPVHRLVRPAPGDLQRRLAADFAFAPAPPATAALQRLLDATPGPAFGLRLPGGRALLLRLRDPSAVDARLPQQRSPAWRALDSARFDALVAPLLDGAQVEARGDGEAAADAVDADPAAALFLLRAVPAGTVLALAEAGELLPAKSTWFRPKPRAGLVLRHVGGGGATGAVEA